MAVGLVAALCAFGTLAAPALAKKPKRPPAVFGKFVASLASGAPITTENPVTASGHGELAHLSLLEGGLVIDKCSKELKSRGKVDAARSETFLQDITFSKCFASIKLGKSGFTKDEKIHNFTLGVEFHSNQSVVIGESEESEVTIKPGTFVSIPVGKGTCVARVPEQTVPVKAKTKEKLFSAASYATEIEEPVSKKKFPAGFQEKLNIEMTFTKIKSEMKPTPTCTFEGEESELNGEGYAVFHKGDLEAELEEITIKHGDLGFETKEEVEAEEAV